MDSIQFLTSDSSRLEKIANQLKETGFTIDGKFVQSRTVVKNQTVASHIKKASEPERVDIIDALGLTEEFNSSSSETVAKVQATATVDLSQEVMSEFSSTNKKGVTTTVPIVMFELLGLSESGSSLTFLAKSGKTICTRSSKAFQLFFADALKVGDMVAFNPDTIKPASYAVGYYDGGINISANANAVLLYKARAENKARAKAKLAEYIDSGMSKDDAIAKITDGITEAVGAFVPKKVVFK